MAVAITVASQKGGVGKTTSVINLAACLALAGKKALILDLDPQGNASSGVGHPKNKGEIAPDHSMPEGGLLSSLLKDLELDPLIVPTPVSGLSLLPSTPELSRLDLIQEVQATPVAKLKPRLSKSLSFFDFVLIDCPPSLAGLPTVALSMSQYVIIPVQCEYYAMEGLSQILPVIHKVREASNRSLEIGGFLLTMFADELELSHEVVREVESYFQDSVFQTIVPRDVVLAEAASHGVPAMQYAPLSRGAWSYVELAREVLAHDWT